MILGKNGSKTADFWQYFADISSKKRIWKKNRVECNGSEYTGADYKIRIFPTPPDIGAYGGCVTEGDGDGEGVGDVDGHSICLKDADTSDSRSVSGLT